MEIRLAYLYRIGWMVILVLCLGLRAYGQTDNDLRLGYDPLVCVSDTSASSRMITMQNFCFGDNRFDGGTFRIDWGDSQQEVFNVAELTHEYAVYGDYSVVLSWKSADGLKSLSKTFPFTLKRGPTAGFSIPSSGSCINTQTTLQIDGYEKESPETKYYFYYGEKLLGTYTQDEVVATRGVVQQVFTEKICNAYLKLTLRNQCVEEGLIEEENTASLRPFTVMAPADIDFKVNPDPVCTGNPFVLEVDKEKLGVCGAKVDFTWSLEGKGGYNGESPVVPPYESKGDYEITLTAKVNGYACANASIAHTIQVINRVKADFVIDKDTLCFGGAPFTVQFTNKSKGDSLQSCVWKVNGNEIQRSAVFRDFKLPVSGPGTYRVELLLDNGCSTDIRDTNIIVRQSPEIAYFALNDYDSICPQTAQGAYLDMADYVGYQWHDNPQAAHWAITPADGVTYNNGNADSQYPRITLQPGKTYELTVEVKEITVNGVVCGDPATRKAIRKLKVKDPGIQVNITSQPAADASGVIRICAGDEVAFTNTSAGEYLEHAWTVTPLETGLYDPNWNMVYTVGSATSAEPTMKFNGYGDFLVTNTLSVYCGSEAKTFRVHVGKNPRIKFFELPDVICPGTKLDMKYYVGYDFYNNLEEATWSFEPEANVILSPGSTKTSLKPEFSFENLPTSAAYKVKVALNPVGCPVPGQSVEMEKTVRVRASALTSSVTFSPGLEPCVNEQVVTFENTAFDPEGNLKYVWKLSRPDDSRFMGPSNTPVVDLVFSGYGEHQLIAEVQSYCDTVSKVFDLVVHKNPKVELKDTIMCPGVLELGDFVRYEWYNNTNQAVTWTVNGPADGYEGNLNHLTPVLNLKKAGDYTISVDLPNPGCTEGIETTRAERTYHVYDTTIWGSIVLKPIGGMTDPGDICEGESVTFGNTTQAEEYIAWSWWVEGGQEGGYAFGDGALTSALKEPVLTFTKYGDYVVKVQITTKCNQRLLNFPVTVRGVPDLRLMERMTKICAEANPVDLSDYLQYADRKNAVITPQWKVSPSAGFSWQAGYGATSDFPRISFLQKGHYTVTLEAASKCADGGKQVLSSEIDVIQNHLKAAFSVDKDSVGCVDDALPYEIYLLNQSDGDSLSYTWKVIPERIGDEGYVFSQGDESSESPAIRFSQQGFYHIRLHVQNICSSDDSVFRIKAFARPEVTIADISGVCEPFEFTGKDRIVVDEHNDGIVSVNWKIDANAGYPSEGYAFIHGSAGTSAYPDIEFKTCDYTVTAEFKNRCETSGTATFQVSVDKFIPIEPLADEEICELTDPRRLVALPAGGTWTFKEPALIDDPARILFRDGNGEFYFNPAFNAYEQKDVELVYRKDHKSCVARDTLNMRVWPLPYVNAGVDPYMCLNNDPLLLVGRDSAVGGIWQENRGDWKYEGNTLENHLFPAVQSGDFQLEYYYTDAHNCRNGDTVVMTVHPLPETGFSVASKSCIFSEVLFTPVDSLGNTFEWDFGDGSARVFSDGKIEHAYDGYGYRDVVCMVESRYHCRDTSAPKNIEIVNLPPPAYFDVDSLIGCPPFRNHISIDRSAYEDDHNYLSFHWDYGEGTKTDTLGPVVPKNYPAGIWDTTYITRFTVSNMCDTVSFERPVSVRSVPQVSFALVHQWECSPVFLELQNTTTGNDCNFHWTFANGRTGEVIERTAVRNPVYEFLTDSASTTFYIHLRAENQCNVDEFTDSLVVKPRSIRAHFTPLESAFACANEEIFFRNNSTDTVASILNTYWNFGDGDQTAEWSPRHTYQEEGVYRVSLKIENGCGWDTVSLPVTVYPLPKLGIESEDELCEADTFHFALTTDQTLKQILWRFGDGETATKDQVSHRYEGYGTFPVSVIGVAADMNQCSDSIRKEVVVHNKPMVTILPLDTIQCSPLLYIPVVEGEAVLYWDYGDGTGLTSAQEHFYENLSDSVQHFRVKTFAETDKGCKDIFERKVTVYNNPKAALGKKVVLGNPQQVTFTNLSEGATDCIWYFPERGMFHSLDDQSVTIGKQGSYLVTMVAENQWHCTDTAFLEHEVLIKGLYFPNTFIPHSQNGKVNRFNGTGRGLVSYKLEIFDQYYNKIWETQALENGEPSEGWDGCNSKGKQMPQGVYIWRAEAIFEDAEVWTGNNNPSGIAQRTQGTVLLLRQ